LRAHHFLQNNRHFLLIDYIRCCSHIRFAVGIKNRSIHSFYSVAQQPKHFISIFKKRNHIGRIYSGERLVMRIFEQTGRPNSNRTSYHLKECHKIIDQFIRQFSLQKIFQNILIRQIGQCNLIKIVCLHKLIENIGAKNHRFRNRDTHTLIIFKYRMPLDHRIYKRKSSSFSP